MVYREGVVETRRALFLRTGNCNDDFVGCSDPRGLECLCFDGETLTVFGLIDKLESGIVRKLVYC